ncbi:hypothetical protein BDV59DRAFT_202275 [Aspergillus ambiguus]|uniref:uncharacterized protein n=1 Tax=Aspergillus ambiguus TaxID=176160 RepID=UPI003CCDF2B0
MSQILAHHAVVGETVGAGFAPGQSNYPSLFRASAEIPPFYVSYRWWEDEATTVLWAFDAQEIKRVIRFGLFRDQQLPRTALQRRNASTVDAFLKTLVEPPERVFTANLSHIQKVEEILRRCKVSTPPATSWSWFPAHKDHDVPPRAMAMAIDAESHLHFTRISFEELVRYSLGYPSASVEWFFQQHTAFYIHLYTYLHAFPEEVARFVEVETYLRGHSPFAHRALVQCLLAVQSGGTAEISTPTAPAFEFIAGPIQRLFKDLPPSLTTILKVLAVLSVRFQRMYVHAREMDWSRPFNVEFSFLEDLLAATSPKDFARTLTTADEGMFGKLTVQSILGEDAVTRRILVQWDHLSIDVWECCTGLPDMIATIQECVQALAGTKNYHSLTAILNGLHKYSITDSTLASTNAGAAIVALNPVIPPDLLYLVHPFQNFAAYRQRFLTAPGIPFLVPHIKDYQEHGQQVLSGMFQQMRTTLR